LFFIAYTLVLIYSRYLMRRMRRIPHGSMPARDGYLFLTHEGVSLSEEMRAAITHFMHHNDIELLDLVPVKASPQRALDLPFYLQIAKDPGFRFREAFSYGTAVVSTSKLFQAGSLPFKDHYDFTELNDIFNRLKLKAPLATETAALDGLTAPPRPARGDYAVLKRFSRGHALLATSLRLIMLLFMSIGLSYSPVVAGLMFVTYMARSRIVFQGAEVRSSRSFPADLILTLPLDLWRIGYLLYFAVSNKKSS
jgi:hypothetical protein